MKSTENEIMNNVYDHLFQNTKMIDLDFCEIFPASSIDEETNTIYLAKNDVNSLYKITIERI